jgi:clan AA aspartic protease
MGKVKQKIILENYIDRYLAEEGKLDSRQVRSVQLEALVATGATMMLLPQEVVEVLGLKRSGQAVVTYADSRKDELDIAGVVTVRIGRRSTNVNCLVGPLNCEPLIGQVVLEELDLIVDPKPKKLTVRPESPVLPLLDLK